MAPEDDELDNILGDLSSEYFASIPAKLDELDTLAKNLKDNPSNKTFELFRNAVHKIAGSAGTYGLSVAGDLCHRFEELLKVEVERFTTSPLSEKSQAQIALFLREIREIMGNFVPKAPEKKSAPPPATPPSTAVPKIEPPSPKTQDQSLDLFILEANEEMIEHLMREGEFRGLKVEGTSDIVELSKRLSQQLFRPKILIVSSDFYSLKEGNGLINKYKEKMGKGGQLALIGDEFSTEDRLKAREQGFNFIMEKPVSTRELLDLIEESFETDLGRPLKVLVLDDDEDIGRFIQEALGELRIDVKTLSESTDFFRALKEFEPDLLLLDLKMPGIDGFNILRAIRSDSHFHHLPVMIITSLTDDQSVEEAYSERIEDFITKPLNKALLQARLQSFIRTLTKLKVSEERDSLTSLYTRRAFLFHMRSFFSSMEIKKGSHALALIGIENFEAMKDLPHLLAQLLVVFGNALSKTFWHYKIMGKVDESICAVLLEGRTKQQAMIEVGQFVDQFREEPFIQTHSDLNVTLKAGISAYPSDATDVNPLMDAARSALHMASSQGERVVLTELKAEDQKALGTICIVDDDPDVHRLLSFAFEKKGFEVNCLKSLEEAFGYFEACKEKGLPDLVVLDRILPDGDGVDLLRKVKSSFGTPPPILMLTQLSSEEDILEGLKAGADDYLIKPFSSRILIERIVKFLKREG